MSTRFDPFGVPLENCRIDLLPVALVAIQLGTARSALENDDGLVGRFEAMTFLRPSVSTYHELAASRKRC
jgi:hypothetical protein